MVNCPQTESRFASKIDSVKLVTTTRYVNSKP